MKAKLMMLGVVAALAMGVMAETVNTVTVSGALVLANASFVVIVSENFRGVQLWKDGSYWAECTVGASEPANF